MREVADETPEPVATRPIAPLRRGGCTTALVAALLLSVSLNFALFFLAVYQQKCIERLQPQSKIPTLVPIEYSSTGHPIIPVEINGETFWWMLDTGAARTVVYAERFPVAKYVRRLKGFSDLQYPLLGLRIRGYHGTVDGLRVGGGFLPSQTVVVEQLADYPESKRPREPIAGILGTDILRHYRCVLAEGYHRESWGLNK